MAANEFIANVVLDAAMMPDMSPREKALRDLFVQEYFFDHNPFAAALRCGFMRSFAGEYADKFMMEPYVQQQIKAREEEVVTDDATAKKLIIANLWRIAKHPQAKFSEQVAALKQLSSMHGADAPVKTENLNVNSQVQFYLPSNGRDPVVPALPAPIEND